MDPIEALDLQEDLIERMYYAGNKVCLDHKFSIWPEDIKVVARLLATHGWQAEMMIRTMKGAR